MECLENAAVYAVANLCQSILTIEFLEDKKSEGRLLSNQPRSVIIMFLCQHLGVVSEEGEYTRDKMSDLAYKPPRLHFLLALRLQNGGCICRTLR